ncbi:hypothetical protein Goshw_008595 [Gossypium schwendimanii]|uniref:RNase H type-1 domain-containing protein n=1 Tax=Gossypium schwendimanii TaxID=34291 RepID=A0A7J9KR14_GOSSC|nr:hypothetical protein [Gossypium schwendimanii]
MIGVSTWLPHRDDIRTTSHTVLAKNTNTIKTYTAPNNLNLVTFWEWFYFLVQDRAERVWEKVIIAVWAIWWARNRQTMEGKIVTGHETVAKIMSMHDEIEVLKEKLPAVREVDIDRWKPPQDSWVKLNFDAAYKVQSNKSCSGFIIRNEEGEVMGSGITLHSNVLDAGLAEALACYQGLLFAKEMGFTK